jgi:hypothetical protein
MMKEGERLTFGELWEWLRNHPKKKWRLYALGGTLGWMNKQRWDDVWENDHHETTDGGHKTMVFWVLDDENHLQQEIGFGEYEDLDYTIEVRHTGPLELVIEFRDRVDMDSVYTVWQEL